MSVNKVILVGNCGKNPELAYTKNNATAVCNMTMATEETFKDRSGNKQKKTTWHTLVFWGKLAEIAAKYLKTGKQIYVEGKLSVRDYQKNGEKRFVTEVMVDEMKFMGSAPGGDGDGQRDQQNYNQDQGPGQGQGQGQGQFQMGDDEVPW